MPEANAAIPSSREHWPAERHLNCIDQLQRRAYLQWLLAQRLLGPLSATAGAPQ